jgi:hypothetical protein
MNAQSPVDPTRCPLCGGDNRCAMEIERATGQAQPPCWCTTASFPPDLLQRLPEAARGQACICPACVQAALAEASRA